MTTMSQMFDAPDIQLNVNDPSFAEDSDDENRDEVTINCNSLQI